jgi:glycine/D-amino acid oxidase-like deaminating enzyme
VKEYPYWWDSPEFPHGRTTFEQSAHQPPPVPARADVVIIGAGYTGLAAARELARRGTNVVVLERERVGWGASSRNGGQVLTGLRLDPLTLVKRVGQQRARQLFESSLESLSALEGLIADESMDCEYERCGHIQAAAKPSHFRAFRAEQKLLASVFNHRIELISASEQRSEVGTGSYFGLLLDQRSGALNPARYVHQLSAAACRAGAKIVEGAAVLRLNRQSGAWLVATEGGVVEADEVLMATNGYTDAAVPSLRRRYVPIGSFVIATEPLSEEQAATVLPRKRMAFDSKNFLHYFRLTRDLRLLFGGRAAFTDPTVGTIRRAAEILRHDMLTVFPFLAGSRIDYAWGGNVAFTRDQLPHAGRLDDAYYAGGYCGHGVAMATHLGGLIARRIAGERVAHPLFDDEFAPIPFYTGKPWFLPLLGAYFKIKDWLS